MNHKITLVSAFAALTLPLLAQTSTAPQFINPSPGSNIVITKMSNNGKWMISETAGTTDGSINPAGGVLINIDNPAMKYTLSHSSGLAGVSDVTDDGSMVVGECQLKPAYWLAATGQWTNLPLPKGYTTGRLNAVTPDGHYAVGTVGNGDEYVFAPVCYDLTTKTVVELPNLPNRDMTNSDQGQNALLAISPDGRYILGDISRSYIMPIAVCAYVYDRETQTYNYIGFDEPATATGKWQPQAENLTFVDAPAMSPNGEWITGSGHVVKNTTGSDFGTEYDVAFRYNVKNNKFELYDGMYDTDMMGFSVTNDGVVLAATPAVNPYSSAMVRKNGMFYSLSQIFKQVYNIDFEAKTGFAVTGKPVEVSDDGLTMAFMPSTNETYILKVEKPLAELCEGINPLNDYTLSPAAGSVFSQLRSFTINFVNPVTVTGNATRITISDGAGKSVKASRASVEASTVTVSFSPISLDPGKTYTVTVPAGIFTMNGSNNTVKNPEIKFTYTGRNSGAVKATAVYPADGNAFARLDLSTNPILVTFDANVAPTTGAKGYFYNTTETGDELICELNIACNGNQMMAFPTAGQYLFKDLDYTVVIPAGTITDISGQGANEELTFRYVGAYVREIPTDNRYIFNEDCSSYSNFLFYDGDQLTPQSVPASWGFTATETPWYIVRSGEDVTDMAFGSHSMYTPAGKSDDWVSTPQLYLSDDKCVLTFDSQSYLNDKKDYLKVYVLVADDIYGTLSESVIKRFRTEGTVIYNELQTPGKSEEDLEGDWRHNAISLEQFAGKNVYIAFVNENDDQSAIFIDNIAVLHDTKYVASFSNGERLINKESVNIKGNIDITSELDTYSSIKLVLKDGNGNKIDEISETNLTLKNGDTYEFTFEKAMPLTVGEEHKFTVDITLDDETSQVASSIKNLAFEPVQKVVIEEITGQGCPNCPRGILAIENLVRLYGNKVVPIALHCYTGDELGAGLHSVAQFLNLTASPTAVVNRGGITSPMLPVDNNYRFTAGNTGDDLAKLTWLDMVQREFEKQSDAQISITSEFNDDTNEFTLKCNVKSALNLTGQNINLMAVVTEDNILTFQSNNNHTYENPDLGDWGKGGKYGQSTVYPYYATHVARAYYGLTNNGTGGYIPQAIESGKDYTATLTGTLPATVNVPDNCHIAVMMIDGNTNRIINADQVSLTGRSGIESVATDKLNARVVAVPSAVLVTAEGNFTVEVYSLAGSLIAIANGTDAVEVPTGGATGVAIVRVVSATSQNVAKVVLK